MKRDVVWTRPAVKDLGRLERSDRERVTTAISGFAENDSGDVRRLVDAHPPRFRLRVGSLRLIFTLAHPHQRPGAVVVLRVLPRDKA